MQTDLRPFFHNESALKGLGPNVRHPLLRLILMKTDDRALHCHLACAPGRVRTYDLLRTVNDASREVLGCLRCHKRCHQGRRRWTRAMNCSTW